MILLPAANLWATPFTIGAGDITVEVTPLSGGTFEWAYVVFNNLPAPGTDGIVELAITVNPAYIVASSVDAIDNGGVEPTAFGLNGGGVVSWQWTASTLLPGLSSWELVYEATVGELANDGVSPRGAIVLVEDGGFGAGVIPGAGDFVAARFPVRNSVPEPATLFLLGSGLLTLGGLRRKLRK